MAAAFDRATLIELFDYTTFTWSAYGNAVRALPPDALTQRLEGSGWGDVRHALFHVAGGWDSWARDRLGLTDPLPKADGLTSWGELDAVRQRTRGWLRRVIDETTDEGLRADVVVWEGEPFEMKETVAQLLAHILLHERGHHGDVSTLIERLGGTPPNADYLVYRWFRQHAAR